MIMCPMNIAESTLFGLQTSSLNKMASLKYMRMPKSKTNLIRLIIIHYKKFGFSLRLFLPLPAFINAGENMYQRLGKRWPTAGVNCVGKNIAAFITNAGKACPKCRQFSWFKCGIIDSLCQRLCLQTQA